MPAYHFLDSVEEGGVSLSPGRTGRGPPACDCGSITLSCVVLFAHRPHAARPCPLRVATTISSSTGGAGGVGDVWRRQQQQRQGQQSPLGARHFARVANTRSKISCCFRPAPIPYTPCADGQRKPMTSPPVAYILDDIVPVPASSKPPTADTPPPRQRKSPLLPS